MPTYREQLIHWEGKPYGLPLVGEAPVCCYRVDLLKAPAHQAALHKLFGRDLDGPATWEQFAALAEYFRTHRVEGRSSPSLPPWPASEAKLDRLFYTIAAGFARRAVSSDEASRADQENDVFSFHYDLKTGQPRIAAPGFVQALKLLQRLGKCRPKELADNPEEAFRDGRAVLCLTDAPLDQGISEDAGAAREGRCLPNSGRRTLLRFRQGQTACDAGRQPRALSWRRRLVSSRYALEPAHGNRLRLAGGSRRTQNKHADLSERRRSRRTHANRAAVPRALGHVRSQRETRAASPRGVARDACCTVI